MTRACTEFVFANTLASDKDMRKINKQLTDLQITTLIEHLVDFSCSDDPYRRHQLLE